MQIRILIVFDADPDFHLMWILMEIQVSKMIQIYSDADPDANPDTQHCRWH
jgi:hypothetical protein